MTHFQIPSYSLSLWQNKTITENGMSYLEEIKICDLGSSENFLPSDAFNPELTIKDNGEQTFTFSLLNHYWDQETESEITNPILQYIIPERKIKLYYDDEWYDFVIKTTEYTKKNKELSVICNGAFAFELGKQGYSIELDTELENNLDTVFNLGKAIVDQSDWEILDTDGKVVSDVASECVVPTGCTAKSDSIQEIQTEYLYSAYLTQDVTAVKTLDGQDGTTTTFTTGTKIYVFSSGLTNSTNPFNFTVFSDTKYAEYVLKNETIKDAINYSIWLTFNTEANSKGFYLPLINGNEFLRDITLTPLRAERYVSSAITMYDPVVDEYVTQYKVIQTGGITEMGWAKGDLVRRYSEVEYLTPDANINLVSNSSAFLTASGWKNILVNTGSVPSTSKTSIEPFLAAKDTSTTSTEVYDSFIALGFLGAGTTVAANAYYLNSGFNDHKDYITGLNKGQQFVFKVKDYSASGSSTTKVVQNLTPYLDCQLRGYTIDDEGTYSFVNAPLLKFTGSTANWSTGYEYSSIINVSSVPAGSHYYTRDEDTMVYTEVSGALDPTKTYYYISDTYSYIVVNCEVNMTYAQLFSDTTTQYGFFINHHSDTAVTTTLYHFIKDLEVFRYIPKKDETPFLPEEMKTSEINTVYYYYKPDSSIYYKELVQFYTSKTDESIGENPKFQITYSNKCEMRRSVTASKSNRYNILSDLCETFECWMRLHVMRNSDGSIRLKNKYFYEQLTSTEILSFNNSSHTGETLPDGIKYYKVVNGVRTEVNPYNTDYFKITNSERIEANTLMTGDYYTPSVGIDPWIKHDWSQGKLDETLDYYKLRKGFDVANNWTYYRGKIVKRQEKYITFHSSIGADNFVGFTYGTNLTDIARTIESENVVTKLIVEANNNEYAPNGFCSISTAASNTSGESTIYNFNHYINKGFLTKSEVVDDINNLNVSLKKYNNYLSTLTEELLQAETYTTELYSSVTTYKTAVEQTAEEITNQNNQLDVITNQVDSFEKFQSGIFSFTDFTEAETIYSTIIRLQATLATYSKLYDNYNTQYTTWLAKENELSETITEYTVAKKNVVAEFELKYAYYIREGTWNSEDYYNAEMYYLDACKTGETYAYPKVSYKLSTLDLSGIEEYSNYKFKIGDCTYIQDVELFGYEADGITPVKQDIAITELKYNLTDPSKNTITIATFENEFVDLFTKFTATTQKLEYREAAYERAANSVNVTTGFSQDLLEKAFANNNITITQKGDSGIVWDENGITLTNKTVPSALIRIDGGGISVSQNSGESWTPALSASGFNSGLLNNGVLSVNQLKIVDTSGTSGFRWDLNGINAFNFKNFGSILEPVIAVDETQFVRFDRFGIYGYQGLETFIPSAEEDIYNSDFVQFALTWSGLHIKTHHEQEIYEYDITRVSNTQITWDPEFDITNPVVWSSSNPTYVTVEGSVGTQHTANVTGIAPTDGEIVTITGVQSNVTHSQNFTVIEQDDGTLYLQALTVTSYNGGIGITNSDDLIVEDAKGNIRLKLGYLYTNNSTPYYGLALFDNDGNSVLMNRSDGTLWIEDKLYIGSESQSDTTRVVLGTDGKYSEWEDYQTPIETSGIPAFSRIMHIYKLGEDSETLESTIINKFQLFDDGTLIMPGFVVDHDGNVHLTLDDATFYGPTFKATSNSSVTTMSLDSLSLRLTSMDGWNATRGEYLRASLGLTSHHIVEDDRDENIGINPYLHFIANIGQNGTTTAAYQKQGLLKMFPNGLWLGNAAVLTADGDTFTKNDYTEGLFLEFYNEEEARPAIFLIHGQTEIPISTSSQAVAVFG